MSHLNSKKYAIKHHNMSGCKYDGKPYEIHLMSTVGFVYKYRYLIPKNLYFLIKQAGWCHDLIEDTGENYNNIKKTLGSFVADLVYALTNEKGRTREERANNKYYKGIRKTEYADFLKICDRLANVSYSKEKQSKFNLPSMFKKYKKENPNFKKKLYNPKYHSMFNELRLLFGYPPISNIEKILLTLRRSFSF